METRNFVNLEFCQRPLGPIVLLEHSRHPCTRDVARLAESVNDTSRRRVRLYSF